MINFSYKSDFIVIVGMLKQGKTYMTKAFLKAIPTFIFVDPKYQASELGYCVHFPEKVLPAFLKWKKVVYQPAKGKDTEEGYTAFYTEILKLSNFTLGIDEIDEHANSYGYICPQAREVIRRGRLQGIGLIGNTRRPSLIHKDIRANAVHIVTFQMMEEDDVKYMADWFYGNHRPETKDKIKNLEKHHSLYLNVNGHVVTALKPI